MLADAVTVTVTSLVILLLLAVGLPWPVSVQGGAGAGVAGGWRLDPQGLAGEDSGAWGSVLRWFHSPQGPVSPSDKWGLGTGVGGGETGAGVGGGETGTGAGGGETGAGAQGGSGADRRRRRPGCGVSISFHSTPRPPPNL